MPITLTPDGAVIDHVAEFVYLPKQKLRDLFKFDGAGYRAALAMFVHYLSCNATFRIGTNKGTASSTDRFKADLLASSSNGVVAAEISTYFKENLDEERKQAGATWLEDNWNNLVDQLSNNRRFLEVVTSHFCRDFINLSGESRLVLRESSDPMLRLPQVLKARMAEQIARVSRELKIDLGLSPEDFVERQFKTHYIIYGEYHICLNRSENGIYLPSITRSYYDVPNSLNLDVFEITSPFLALNVLKGLKSRRGLVEHVEKWKESSAGKEIVDGMSQLHDLWSMPDISAEALEKEKRRIQDILDFGIGESYRTFLDATRIIKLDVDAKTASDMSKSSMSSQSWLWKLRAPNALRDWPNLVQSLIDLAE